MYEDRITQKNEELEGGPTEGLTDFLLEAEREKARIDVASASAAAEKRRFGNDTAPFGATTGVQGDDTKDSKRKRLANWALDKSSGIGTAFSGGPPSF